MKQITEKQILELFSTKKCSIAKKYERGVIFIKSQDSKIYPFAWSTSGSHITAHNYTDQITSVLDALNLDYTMGNDAPRGGKNGDFIELNDSALKTLKSIRKQQADMIAEAKKADELAKQAEIERLENLKKEIYAEYELLKPFIEQQIELLREANKLTKMARNDANAVFMKAVIASAGVNIQHFWQVFRVINANHN